MKKYAVIDLGTNSVRLMTAEVKDYKLISCRKDVISTRLGKGVNENGFLSESAIDMTIEALKVFKRKTDKVSAEAVGIIATSAVRDSKNREYFVDRVKSETGMCIDVISGETEADLAYKGVRYGACASSNISGNDDIMIIDIGGGSTEVIIGNVSGIKFSRSFDLGAVRLTEMFIRSDPPERHDTEDMKNYIESCLKGDLCEKFSPAVCVGIAGTVTTIAAISMNMRVYDRNEVEGYCMSRSRIEEMTKMLSGLSLEKRKKLDGLQPQRADIIVAGSVLFGTLLDVTGINAVVVSDFDNLEGVLVDKGIITV